jgi:hypothetical protein
MAGAAGYVWKMTGDGATATRGEINNSNNFDNVIRLVPYETQFKKRVRAKRSADFNGNLVVLNSGTGGTTTTITSATLTEDWAWYESDAFLSSTIGSVLTVKATGTPANNSWVAVDVARVYPASEPKLPGRLFVSLPQDPETFIVGTEGEASVNEFDGQRITCCYEIRGVLHVAKENSLYSVVDNGDVPGNWPVEKVSDIVGTPSLFGAATGEGWAVIADQAGLFMDDGGQLDKISHEIQPDWDRINWTYGHIIRVAVDTKNKRISVLCPRDGATENNTKFVLDYVEGFGEPIAGGGTGRKWTTWTIPYSGAAVTNDCAYIQISQSQKAIVLAGGLTAGTGFVVKQDTTTPAKSDNFSASPTPAAFESYYETAQLGKDQGRSLYGYLTMSASGSGTLESYLITPKTTPLTLPSRSLAADTDNDLEVPFHKTATALGVKIATSGVSDSFTVTNLSLFAKDAPFGAFRGHNVE